MAKGQTNQPLWIEVLDEDLYQTPEMDALREAGHTVTRQVGPTSSDLIVGRRAYHMTPDLLKHLPTTIKAIRAGKRKKKGDE